MLFIPFQIVKLIHSIVNFGIAYNNKKSFCIFNNVFVDVCVYVLGLWMPSI